MACSNPVQASSCYHDMHKLMATQLIDVNLRKTFPQSIFQAAGQRAQQCKSCASLGAMDCQTVLARQA